MCSWGSGGPGYPILEALDLCLQDAPSDALKPRMAFFSTKSANRAPISMMRLCPPTSVLCGQPAQPRPFYPECL